MNARLSARFRLGAALGALAIALVTAPLAATAAEEGLETIREQAAAGDARGALERLEDYLERQPEAAEGHFLRGLLLVQLGRHGEAESAFRRVTELEPSRPEPYNNLAVLQAAAGRYDEAVSSLRASLRTRESYRTAFENLNKIYGRLASEAYREALDREAAPRAERVELALLSELERTAGRDERLAEVPERMPAAASAPAAAPDEPAAPPRSEPARAETPRSETPRPAADGQPGQSPAEPSAAASEAVAVRALVERWRSAWESQRVDDYLATYAGGFRPDSGESRAAWEQLRRQRLSAPSFIRVKVAYVDEPRVENDRAVVRFLQSYESNTFQDTVTKRLELVREDGWKILSETVEP